jgi:hypothetical protein
MMMEISRMRPGEFYVVWPLTYTTYIRNRVLSRTIKITPFESWNGRKPNMSDLRIFGTRAFVRIPDTATKLGARSQEGVFVGRCNTQNAFRIYIPKTRKIVVSKDVKIDEQILYRDTNNSSPLTVNLLLFFSLSFRDGSQVFFFSQSIYIYIFFIFFFLKRMN